VTNSLFGLAFYGLKCVSKTTSREKAQAEKHSIRGFLALFA